MSAQQTGKLPSALFVLWEALAADETMLAPDSVFRLFQAAADAYGAELNGGQPFPVLDNAFALEYQRNPDAYRELAEWLALHSVRDRARTSGVFWAWAAWCYAADKLLMGAKAGEAFAQAQRRSRGRPSSAWSELRDAVYVANALRRRGFSWLAAADAASGVSGIGRRNIDAYQRSRKGPDIRPIDAEHEDRLAACAIYERGWDGKAVAHSIQLPADLTGHLPLSCSLAPTQEDSERAWLATWNALPDTPD